MRLSTLAAIDRENTFSLVVVAPDGGSRTDSVHDTLESAEKESAEMGSRWIFYPFHFAIDVEGKAWPLFEEAGPDAFATLDDAREWVKEFGGMIA